MHRWFWLEISVTWKRKEWSQWIVADCWQNSWVSLGATFTPLSYLNWTVFFTSPFVTFWILLGTLLHRSSLQPSAATIIVKAFQKKNLIINVHHMVVILVSPVTSWSSDTCFSKVLNSLRPAPRTTSTWSRPLNVLLTLFVTRCPRAWTLIQPSPQELPLPNSQTALRPSSSLDATVSDWCQEARGRAAQVL